MYTIIPKHEINDRQDEICSTLFGIGKPKSITIAKKKIVESYSYGGSYNDNDKAINDIVLGKDYKSELESLHQRVIPHLELDEKHNAVDNYIHDNLKQGKPDGYKVEHILDTIHSQPFDNRQYLQHKWLNFLHEHARVEPLIRNKSQSYYTENEIKNIPAKYNFKSYRVIEHPISGQYFEAHPTKGLRYLGTKTDDTNRYLHYKSSVNSNWANTDASLTRHYDQFPNDSVEEYSRSSEDINNHLRGIISSYPMSISDLHSIEHNIKDLSNHINMIIPPVNHPSFNTYTGIHSTMNPKLATSRDEHGHILIKSPAFVSTSLEKNVAKEFASPTTDNELNHRCVHDILKIKIPSGYSRGAYIKPFSEQPHENEYLLDKDHTFVIHPEPKYFATNDMLYRQWDTRIHTHVDTKKWSALSKNDKYMATLDPETRTATLKLACNHLSRTIRASAAKHPNIDPHDHEHAAFYDRSIVRECAMMNPNTPAHMISRAATGIDKFAKIGLAKAPKLDYHTQTLLTGSNSHPDVFAQLAKRTDLNPEIVNRLIDHGDEETHLSLARNTSLLPEHYASLIKKDNNDVTSELVKNTSVPKEHLKSLSNHSDISIRTRAINNGKNWMLD